MELIFLQNSATQPRCHKRYRSFVNNGIKGIVYSFDRELYNVNLPDDIDINIIGKIASGSYGKRLIYYIKKLRPIFYRHSNSVFYCYAQDMAFVALLFGKKYIYEESDLMYLMSRNRLFRWIMRKLDLFIQKKSLATVLTSQGFVNYLYKTKPQNVFVIPNKLDGYFNGRIRPEIKPFNINSLRFGFIGLLRTPKTLFNFIETMIEVSPYHRFEIWGDGSKEFVKVVQSYCDNHKQVTYHGPFRNPGDLENIYSQVDINFVCYDTTGQGNECIAEPNKLYESTFFNTPIMVTPNTYLSSVVNDWGTGFAVNCFSKEDIMCFLESLSEDIIMQKIEACKLKSSISVIDQASDVSPIVALL